MSQPWIRRDEQSGLQTRTAATESVSSCVRMKSKRRLHFADSLASFAAPKRMGLRSNIRLSGVLVKMSWITLPDVSTHLRPGSKAGLGA